MHELKDPWLQFTRMQKQLLLQVQTIMHEYTKDQAEDLKSVLFKLSVVLIYHLNYAKESLSLIYYTGIQGYNVEYKQ